MRQINALAVAIFLVVVIALFALTPRNTEIMQARFLGVIAPLLKNGSSLQKQIIGFREGMKKLNELVAGKPELVAKTISIWPAAASSGTLQPATIASKTRTAMIRMVQDYLSAKHSGNDARGTLTIIACR